MKNQEKYLPRSIDEVLLAWKNEPDKKPLLLRGARQVGKSSAVRAFSRHFEHFVELNFEERRELNALFNRNLSPENLCENLSVFFKTPISPGKTLLFFDEIQACPEAISALRFFYEKMPGLHVVGAGSLLEFALAELPSFGVGRVRFLFVYPFSFDEFLTALGETELLGLKRAASAERPTAPIFHDKLADLFKKHLIMGGMPEVVSKYVQGRGLLEIQSVLDDLIVSFKADFAKYKKRVPGLRVLEVFESVARQMGGKFVFAKAATEAKLAQIKEAVELLAMAGLVIPVTHSSGNGIPLGAESDPKKQKILLFDTGIFQRVLGLNLSEIILKNDFQSINKGAIAELAVGLEILKYGNPFSQPTLHYWQRETPSGNAEVDFLFQKGIQILPIEVKSGHQGAMQSLHLFLKEKGRTAGVRFSLENFSSFNGIEVFPLHAVSSFVRAS